MAQESLKDLSTEKLIEKEKKLKMAAGMLIGMLLVLFVLSVYLSIRQHKFNPLVAVAVALSATLPSTFSGIKQIRQEIDSRS